MLSQFGPFGTVVVAQWVERSLSTPEIRGSNPGIDKISMYYQNLECKNIVAIPR